MLNAPAVSGIRNLSTALNRSVGLLITTAVQTAFRKCEYWPLVPLGAIGIIEIHAYGVEFDDFVLCPEMPTSACTLTVLTGDNCLPKSTTQTPASSC